MKIDRNELSAIIAERLGCARVTLTPIAVECAWSVFKAEAEGWTPLFVKLTEKGAAERLLMVLASVEGCPLFPRSVIAAGIPFGEHAVVCLEWRAGDQVNAEEMSDGQLQGFLDGCLQMSNALSRYEGPLMNASEDDPARQYEALRDYVSRHRLVGRLLSALVDLPEPERTYGGRTLANIHGDFQPKNYAFDGDRIAAVYDIDDVSTGLPCEDAAYAFTERARRRELSASARRRLTELFLRLTELSPWPKDDWLIAVNHARLRIAARRLAKHPNSPFAAFDICLRDRPLRTLAAALKGHHA